MSNPEDHTVGRHRVGLDDLLREHLDPESPDMPSRPVDVDEILTRAREQLLAWEQAEAGSHAEHVAGGELGSNFALLDREAVLGNLPAEWQPVTRPYQFSNYQQGLIALFGTCQRCAGPRNTRNVTTSEGSGWKTEMYCTICGEVA